MAELSVRLFGQFRLLDAAGRELAVSARKARALLALLALRLGDRQSRERLASLIWEDADPEAARSSLRQALTALRRALPESAAAALQTDAATVALDEALVDVDVARFRSAPEEHVLELYEGHLLEGFDARSGAFQDLVAPLREALRRDAVGALERLQARAAERGDDELALRALLRLTALEPVNENAQRALMELYARRGQLTEALQQYRRFAEHLRHELGVQPEPRTEALHRELLRRRREPSPRAAEAPGASAPEPPSAREPGLREATVLCARTALSEGADPERAVTLLAEAEDTVRRVVGAFGGAEPRAVGSSVMTAFGLAEIRGNEAERGLRAALELAAAGLAVGMAQGQVLSHGRSTSFAGAPFASGLTLAALAAPGEVVVSDELCRALAPRLTAERLASAPGVWRVRAFGEPAAPFVGRGSELAMLLSLFERCAATGKGRALLLRGEAGIGKSQLLRAFAAEVRSRGGAVHAAQALDFGQSLSERPLTALARSLGAEELEPASSLGSDDRRRATARVLCELVTARSASTTPVLIVEDAHWADADERAILAHLAAGLAAERALLVLSTRPEGDPVDAAWRALARGCPLTTVELSPLAEDEARALAAHYRELPAEVVSACLGRAEGHPLFLDQLLRAAQAGQASLPGTVRSLVLARLERLPHGARRLVQAAAVLGQRSSREALAHLLEAPDVDVDVNAAEDAGLLARHAGAIAFVHALFRDAVYGTLLRSAQKELHRRAAAWFEPHDAALFAEHLAAAEDPRAGAAALVAARALAGTEHLAHAVQHAERAHALGVAGAAAVYAELLLQIGRPHEALGIASQAGDGYGVASALRVLDRHREALAALDRCEEAALSPAERARVWSLRGNLYFPLGELDACLEAHERARAHAVEAGSIADEVRALGGLGDAWYQRGHMRTARDLFARSVEAARAHDLTQLELANLPMLGSTRAYCGEIEAGRDDAAQARRAARRAGDVRAEIVACVVFAGLSELAAEDAAMLEAATHALGLARQLGAKRFEAEAGAMAGTARLALGDRAGGLAELEAAAALCEEPLIASYCGAMVLGALGVATAEPDRRRALFERAERSLARCVSSNRFEFYRYAIQASIAERDWQRTQRLAAELEGATRSEPLPWSDLLVAAARGWASSGTGDETTLEAAVRSGFRWLAVKLRPA